MNGKEIQTLLQALPYMRRLKGATLVIRFGGAIARDKAALGSLAQDIALCGHVGLRVVVVHGGGPQATDLSRKLGHEPTIVDGRRVTDDQTLEVAKMVFGGQINIDILGALRMHGLKPVGLSGVDGGLINAADSVVSETDRERDIKHRNRIDPHLRLSCRVIVAADLTVTAPYW